jgi:hypothetical protein
VILVAENEGGRKGRKKCRERLGHSSYHKLNITDEFINGFNR